MSCVLFLSLRRRRVWAARGAAVPVRRFEPLGSRKGNSKVVDRTRSQRVNIGLPDYTQAPRLVTDGQTDRQTQEGCAPGCSALSDFARPASQFKFGLYDKEAPYSRIFTLVNIPY